MTYRILAAALAATIGLAAAPSQAVEMKDLPVNARTISMTYVYCLTGDTKGAAHILAQRIKYTGAKNAQAMAADWVSKGYCTEYMKAAAKVAPKLEDRVVKGLRDAGFNPDEPASTQAAKGKKGLGKVVKAIGKFLGGLFGGGGGAGGKGTYIEYSNEQTGESFSYCDRSWGAGSGDWAEAMEPTPYNPNPDGT